MRTIWLSSDSHFGHSNIIKYCNRPFKDPQEMDEAIIENHNKLVKPEDIWYHLGDVYFTKKCYALERMNGHKRLILGNHDDGKDPYLQQHFEKILVWRMFPEFGLLLTHVPVHLGEINNPHAESRKEKYSVNIHGHLHEKRVTYYDNKLKKEINDPRYVSVCMEHINYSPVNIEELRVK